MKGIISIIAIIFSISASAQNSNEQKPKIDSAALQQAQIQMFWKQRGDTLSVKSFLNWNYDRVSAKKYDELIQAYNAFIQEQYTAWIKQQK